MPITSPKSEISLYCFQVNLIERYRRGVLCGCYWLAFCCRIDWQKQHITKLCKTQLAFVCVPFTTKIRHATAQNLPLIQPRTIKRIDQCPCQYWSVARMVIHFITKFLDRYQQWMIIAQKTFRMLAVVCRTFQGISSLLSLQTMA